MHGAAAAATTLLLALLPHYAPPAFAAAASPGAGVFKLQANLSGAAFLPAMDFFSGITDPAGGYVEYVTAADAATGKLAYVDGTGAVVLRVDNSTSLPPPAPDADGLLPVQHGDRRGAAAPPGPPVPCYVGNYSKCNPCDNTNFYGFDGDDCDLVPKGVPLDGRNNSAIGCCELCHEWGPNCTGYSLDQGICYLKQVENCSPRPSPPPGK